MTAPQDIPPGLAAAIADAAQIDAGATVDSATGDAGAPGDAPGLDPLDVARAELAMVVQIVGSMAAPLVAIRWPELVRAYGQAQQAQIIETGARLAVHTGWSLGAWLERYGPHFAFAAALVAPALPLASQSLAERIKGRIQSAASGAAGAAGGWLSRLFGRQ